MTYTIVARCPETERLGVGIATYSLGVGGYCPFVARGVAALSTQAFANPTLGPLATEALAGGHSPAQTLSILEAADLGYAYRQVCIVGQSGDVAMHTGASCRAWAGHEVGDGFAAFGNVLTGEATVAAMAAAYRASSGQSLDQRLLSALEAGRDAGGQAGGDGSHLTERSAALIVQGQDIVEDLNLRVDLHEDAVTELRRVHAGYAPYLEYYVLRARDPANTPAQDVWARENLT
ncbi:MAG: DUF1028 domain-containing protein [Alphaproteobacteria bacterium]